MGRSEKGDANIYTLGQLLGNVPEEGHASPRGARAEMRPRHIMAIWKNPRF
jgi:hypothetical protein